MKLLEVPSHEAIIGIVTYCGIIFNKDVARQPLLSYAVTVDLGLCRNAHAPNEKGLQETRNPLILMVGDRGAIDGFSV